MSCSKQIMTRYSRVRILIPVSRVYIRYRERHYPQIVPVLYFIDSKITKFWARSPLELFEMFLLILMGFLEGIINVTRSFINPTTPRPSILEFLYKPALGGVIALGIFVLFRASQLFLGVQNQAGTATGSSSMFLLAALGLISGFCANDAVSQIEYAAAQLFGGSPLVFAYGLEQAITTTGRQNDAEELRSKILNVDNVKWAAWIPGKAAIPRETAQRIADYLHLNMDDTFKSVPSS